MKKLVYSLAIILTSCFLTDAQIYVGPRAGANYSMMNVSGSYYTGSKDPLVSFHAGATVRWQFMKRLSAQGDVLFSQTGFSSSSISDLAIPGGLVNRTIIDESNKFNYINVPLYISYEIPLKRRMVVPYNIKEEKVFFNLYVGPSFSYLLSASNNYTTQITTYTNGQVTDVTPEDKGSKSSTKGLNSIDIGAMAGLGFGFKINEKSKLTTDFRYNLGFLDVFDSDKNSKATNAFPQFSLSYQYNIIKRTIRHRN